MMIHTDCRHFDGYKPCGPHKAHGVHCDGCQHYDPVGQRILIFKLGAAGEVIRCTPILRYLRENLPHAYVVWVTDFPELIPDGWADKVVKLNWETAEWLKTQTWNLVLSLDKDSAPCAIARQCRADQLKGFTLDDHGHIAPADGDSQRKWQTGIFDDLMKATRSHYVEEMFELCGWHYSGETYILPRPEPAMLNPVPGKGPIVGLNTGAGKIWPTRIWPEEYFESLIYQLHGLGMRPVLLGGPDEHDRNVRLARKTGTIYHGIKPLRQFLSVIDSCDVVVTSVTMALHMAIGLEKRIVLLNNIFNRHEFHLFGLGEILEPPLGCLGCYKRKFDDGCPVENCMREIPVEAVLRAIVSQAGRLKARPDSIPPAVATKPATRTPAANPSPSTAPVTPTSRS